MLSKKPWFCYYSLVAVLVVDPAAAATAACFAQYVRSVCVVHGRYTNWKRKRILSENTRQHLVVFGNENKQGIRRRQRREHCRKINEYSYNNNKKQWRFVSFAGRSQIRTLCVCVCLLISSYPFWFWFWSWNFSFDFCRTLFPAALKGAKKTDLKSYTPSFLLLARLHHNYPYISCPHCLCVDLITYGIKNPLEMIILSFRFQLLYGCEIEMREFI